MGNLWPYVGHLLLMSSSSRSAIINLTKHAVLILRIISDEDKHG